MTAIRKSIMGAAIGAAAFAVSAAGASAAVVCVGDVCWHSAARYDYPAHAHVVIHDDNWKWGRHEHYRWREHEGRGYWRGRHWESW